MKPSAWARSRRYGVALAAGTAGSLLVMAALPASGAIHKNHPVKIAVPQGIGAAALKSLTSSGVFTPGSTPRDGLVHPEGAQP